MRTENINLTHINDTVLDVYTIPVPERMHDNGFNLSKHNLTWEAKHFHGKELNLKLKFDYPLVHSPLPK